MKFIFISVVRPLLKSAREFFINTRTKFHRLLLVDKMGEKNSKEETVLDKAASLGEHLMKDSTRLSKNITKHPENTTELLLQRARYFFLEGDYYTALDDVIRYLKEEGVQKVNAHSLQAACYEKLGDFLASIEHWNIAKNLYETQPTIPHAFEQETFFSPTWCCKCQELLKGIKRQGMRCQHCELTIHQSCADNFETPCGTNQIDEEEGKHNFIQVKNRSIFCCEFCKCYVKITEMQADVLLCLKCGIYIHMACSTHENQHKIKCKRIKIFDSYWKILLGIFIPRLVSTYFINIVISITYMIQIYSLF